MKQQQNKLFKRLKNSTINQSLAEIKHKFWTLSCEGIGGSALGDTLNKAPQISLDEYYFLYFRLVTT